MIPLVVMTVTTTVTLLLAAGIIGGYRLHCRCKLIAATGPTQLRREAVQLTPRDEEKFGEIADHL